MCRSNFIPRLDPVFLPKRRDEKGGKRDAISLAFVCPCRAAFVVFPFHGASMHRQLPAGQHPAAARRRIMRLPVPSGGGGSVVLRLQTTGQPDPSTRVLQFPCALDARLWLLDKYRYFVVRGSESSSNNGGLLVDGAILHTGCGRQFVLSVCRGRLSGVCARRR